jgi:hypothetical protein
MKDKSEDAMENKSESENAMDKTIKIKEEGKTRNWTELSKTIEEVARDVRNICALREGGPFPFIREHEKRGILGFFERNL